LLIYGKTLLLLPTKIIFADFDNGVIKHIWYEKLPSPYLLYIKSLYEYFNIDTSKHIRTPYDITKGKFLNLKYQEDDRQNGIDNH